jgi:PIN domain nuclease of toxin-antitoxin system
LAIKVVLDASVVLAVVFEEPGAEAAAAYLDESVISAVNYTEVVTRMVQKGIPIDEIGTYLDALDLGVVAYDETIARIATRFAPLARSHGVSLGDRACLATATYLERPVATAESLWSKLELPCSVIAIRCEYIH